MKHSTIVKHTQGRKRVMKGFVNFAFWLASSPIEYRHFGVTLQFVMKTLIRLILQCLYFNCFSTFIRNLCVFFFLHHKMFLPRALIQPITITSPTAISVGTRTKSKCSTYIHYFVSGDRLN